MRSYEQLRCLRQAGDRSCLAAQTLQLRLQRSNVGVQCGVFIFQLGDAALQGFHVTVFGFATVGLVRLVSASCSSGVSGSM